MIKYFYFNDQLYPVDQPVLLPYDLALLRGYGIFDYFLFNQGQPRFLGDYLNRFINSAKTLGLDLRRDKTGLEEVIMEVIRANGQTDGGIRLFLSGGYAEDGYTPTNPNFAVLQYPFPEIPIHYYKDGIRLSSLQYQREVPKVKTTNYITGIKHQPWLKKQGSDFILYHDGKYVRESDRSNFFMINQEGVLCTPATGVLEGISRGKIIEVAKKIMPVEVRDFSLEEVWNAQEAFFTSTIKWVMPVVSIDGRPIGNGKPGPIADKLRSAFLDLIPQYSAPSFFD